MGALRGQRNAAREKSWPGANAEAIREMKRDYENFSSAGKMDWKRVQAAADELLPDIPRIEFGTAVQSQTAVVLVGRALKPPETQDGLLKKSIRLDNQLAMAQRKLAAAPPRKLLPPAPPPPLRDTPIEYVVPKTAGGCFCDRCGKPRHGLAPLPLPGTKNKFIASVKHYCQACYRLNSAERREEKLKAWIAKKEAFEKSLSANNDRASQKLLEAHKKRLHLLETKERLQLRLDGAGDYSKELEQYLLAVDGYNYWVEDFRLCIPKEMPDFDGGNWESGVAENKMKNGTSHVLIRSCPDFSDELIEAIEEAEEAFDAPIAKWPIGRSWSDLFAKEGQHRTLSFSSDAAERMAHGTAKPRVRHERPRWKMIRGEWA